MPVAAIPFKAPAPFDIPPMMTEPMRAGDRDAAAAHALGILEQLDAGDAMAVAWVGDGGALAAGPWSMPRGGSLDGLDPAFMAPAVADAKPLLFMGDLDDAAPFPAPLRAVMGANTGFLYIYPLMSPAGEARGALMIHRALADGPLNHDQPAIAHALAHLLGEAAARG